MKSNRKQLPNRATALGGVCAGMRARGGWDANLGALASSQSLRSAKRGVGIAFH